MKGRTHYLEDPGALYRGLRDGFQNQSQLLDDLSTEIFILLGFLESTKPRQALCHWATSPTSKRSLLFSLHAIIYFHKSVHVCVQATAHDWRLADNFQEVRSFLPPCGCQVLNSGHQACQQTPFSAEPSHRPKTDICDLGQKTKGKEFPLCVHTLSP